MPRSRAVGGDSWAAFDWVVWQIEVLDPEFRISTPYDSAGMAFLLAEDSREVMVDFAARIGCVYEGCKDDGTWGDNDPYYAWWIRVPQDLHTRRSPQGWPVAVEEIRQELDRTFADQHHWSCCVDERRTRVLPAEEQTPPLLWIAGQAPCVEVDAVSARTSPGAALWGRTPAAPRCDVPQSGYCGGGRLRPAGAEARRGTPCCHACSRSAGRRRRRSRRATTPLRCTASRLRGDDFSFQRLLRQRSCGSRVADEQVGETVRCLRGAAAGGS